jgi:threonine dehydrogenase-like Zn-dependent dehydrogenase
MRAVVTRAGTGRAWLQEVPEPELTQPTQVLVHMLRVGVCGTDRHVMAMAAQRNFPSGDDFLVLGHEAVGRVEKVGDAVTTLNAGDYVVPTVRRGCGECSACAANQADLCFSMRYKERGIVGLHGFLSEWIVDHEEVLIRVPEQLAQVAPLVESLTTPEKALRRITNARAHLPADRDLRSALVTGSGPIALLAMLAARLRDIPTTLVARQARGGQAEAIATSAGAKYVQLSEVDLDNARAVTGDVDAVIEATGAVEMGVGMLSALAPNGVLDLVGGVAERKAIPMQATLLGSMVGRNLTLLGSVNANADDWQTAVRDLTGMREKFPGVVESLITHHFGMQDVESAFERIPGQIKAIIDVA